MTEQSWRCVKGIDGGRCLDLHSPSTSAAISSNTSGALIDNQHGLVASSDHLVDASSYGGAGAASMVVTRCSVVHTASGDMPLKEHVCTVCGKAFRSVKDCKRHTIIHSGSKPYRCPFCSHTANLSFNLKKHIQKIHPDQFPVYAAQHYVTVRTQ